MYWLREVAGVDAWLVHLLFEDDHTHRVASRAEWEAELPSVDEALGIAVARSPFAGHCFLPALAPDELERSPRRPARAPRPSGDPVAAAMPAIAARMQALAEELGSASALREVRHLEPTTVAALKKVFPDRTVEKNRRLAIPSWSPVGNVDVLVRPAAPNDSLTAVQLKWCFVDKLYEAIWDLFKMALLATTGARTYLITGASPQMWANSVGRELFADGVHGPEALCEVRLPWGQKLRAWDDLLWGGYDRYPLEVPSQIRTTIVAREAVRGSDGDWELLAIRVEPVGAAMSRFVGGWPFPRPADAVRPLIATTDAPS